MTIGEQRHLVTLQTPTAVVATSEGGSTQLWANLSPAHVYAAIRPATARELERTTAGTTQSTATHIVTLRYHPQVTTQTRILFGSRVLLVTGVSNVEERNRQLILTCVEIEAAPPTMESWMEPGWVEG